MKFKDYELVGVPWPGVGGRCATASGDPLRATGGTDAVPVEEAVALRGAAALQLLKGSAGASVLSASSVAPSCAPSAGPITEVTPNSKASSKGTSSEASIWAVQHDLAANQISVQPARVLLERPGCEISCIASPRIVALSEDEYRDGGEGCLSVPELVPDRARLVRAL